LEPREERNEKEVVSIYYRQERDSGKGYD